MSHAETFYNAIITKVKARTEGDKSLDVRNLETQMDSDTNFILCIGAEEDPDYLYCFSDNSICRLTTSGVTLLELNTIQKEVLLLGLQSGVVTLRSSHGPERTNAAFCRLFELDPKDHELTLVNADE